MLLSEGIVTIRYRDNVIPVDQLSLFQFNMTHSARQEDQPMCMHLTDDRKYMIEKKNYKDHAENKKKILRVVRDTLQYIQGQTDFEL